MHVQVEAKHIHHLYWLSHYESNRHPRSLTKEEQLVLNLSYLVIAPNPKYVGHFIFIPEWEKFDFVISHSAMEVYWGDILFRRIAPYESSTIHCFFEQCNSVTPTEPVIKRLIECSRYFIQNPPKDICVPVRMLWD